MPIQAEQWAAKSSTAMRKENIEIRYTFYEQILEGLQTLT
jgi:hypothetical protein